MRLDLANAVDWSHPLNRGRTLWYQGLAATGGRVANLCGATAPLRVVTPAARANAPGVNRPALLVPGSGYAIGPTTGPQFGANGASFSFGVSSCRVANVAAGTLFAKSGGGVSDPMFEIRHDGGAGTSIVALTGPNGTISAAGPVVPLLRWVRSVAVYEIRSGTVTLYQNGQRVATATPGTILDTAPLFPVLMGARANGSTNCNAYVDDATLWTRALTPAEIALDYQLSLQGYVGRNSPLRWTGGVSYFVGSGRR